MTTTLLLPTYAATITDSIAQSFSDCYKDDVGCRPRLDGWTRAQMVAWLDAYALRPWDGDEAEALAFAAELEYERMLEEDWEDAQDRIDIEREAIASKYQEGWA